MVENILNWKFTQNVFLPTGATKYELLRSGNILFRAYMSIPII
jgi:hypothetical protein